MFGRCSKPFTRFLLHGRLRAVFYLLLLFISAIILGLYAFGNSGTNIRWCFVDEALPPFMYNGFRRLDDVLLAEHPPRPGQSIFFHETSCHQLNRNDGNMAEEEEVVGRAVNTIRLSARQACAIESAALHNPDYDVFVLFASPTYSAQNNTPIVSALLSYDNVQLRNLNLWTYAAGTPIDEWFQNGEIFRSRYVLSHLSDFLRYLTLYRYGGIYLDMDTVTLHSLDELRPNFSGAESPNFVAAGVMGFAPDGLGHDIALSCLREFEQSFDGNDWGNNGPGVITRVAQRLCHTTRTELMSQPDRCKALKVYKPEAFYAIPWREWTHFFEPARLEATLERTKNSHLVHVWNKHSKRQQLQVGSKAAYMRYAEQHCPKVVAASGEYF